MDTYLDALICEVRKRPALWSRRSAKYRNRALSEKLWDSVGLSLGIPRETAKSRWRNLRDQFQKELKKIPASHSEDPRDVAAVYKGKWLHFADMLFLKGTVNRRIEELHAPEEDHSTRAFENFQESDEAESVDIKNIFTCLQEPLPQSSSDSLSPVQQASSSTPTTIPQKSIQRTPVKRAKWKESSPSSSLYQHDSALLDKSEEDDDVLFLKSLLPYIRKLPPLRKLHVRNQFQNIVFEEYSSIISQRSPALPT